LLLSTVSRKQSDNNIYCVVIIISSAGTINEYGTVKVLATMISSAIKKYFKERMRGKW